MAKDSRMRQVWRIILAVFYGIAGYLHLTLPAPFLSIMPGWVPMPDAVVLMTGMAELAGAAGLIQPFSAKLRRAAAIGLALYAVCVFPANINHMMIDMAKATHGAGLAYHGPRLLAQPIIVWLALWVGGVIDWPFRRPGSSQP